MAMADLTGAVGIASRRARAQGSQPPPPVGDGTEAQTTRIALFMRELLSPLADAVGMAKQLQIASCGRNVYLLT